MKREMNERLVEIVLEAWGRYEEVGEDAFRGYLQQLGFSDMEIDMFLLGTEHPWSE